MNRVTVDASKRVRLREAKPGDCYLTEVSPDGGRIVLVRLKPEKRSDVTSRNRRESPPRKHGRTIWDALEDLGKAGLRIEEAENGKELVPWL